MAKTELVELTRPEIITLIEALNHYNVSSYANCIIGKLKEAKDNIERGMKK